jgi:sirohydrochlorin ferrochelatase
MAAKTAQAKKAIVLVDHGSVRPEANDMLRAVADLVAETAPQYRVEIAHMELAEPTLAQAFAACVAAGAGDITVHPYMLGPGRHSTADIPKLAEDAARHFPGLRFRVTRPLGVDGRVAEVVLDRVREAERAEP